MTPRDKTLQGYDFTDPDTKTRVAVVEEKYRNLRDDVHEIKGTVKDIDIKLDELLLEVARARKASLPPKATILTTGAKQSVGGAVGAAFLYILQMITSQAPKTPPDVKSEHGTPPSARS